ncbi:MAG: YezD family protein [Planctomycetaceae bacterium]
MSMPQNSADDVSSVAESALQKIVDALKGLRYGQVTVIVQDGRVVQIDRTEKHRISAMDRNP